MESNTINLSNYIEVLYEEQDYLMLYDDIDELTRIFRNPFPHTTIAKLPLTGGEVEIGMLQGVLTLLKTGGSLKSFAPLQDNEIPKSLKTKISKEFL